MYPQPITPNNKLPDEYVYDDLLAVMEQRKQYRVKCGNNTYAALTSNPNMDSIQIVHFTTRVATLWQGGWVTLTTFGMFSQTTADRMTRAVSRLGYKVTCRPSVKLYSVYWLDHSQGFELVAELTDWLTLTDVSVVGPEGYRHQVASQV